MNILVIGNGFDIEHGLPTKYDDFIRFIVQFRNKNTEELPSDQMTISDLALNTNIWFNYFDEILKNNTQRDNFTWIDFENEISSLLNEFKCILQPIDDKGTYFIFGKSINSPNITHEFDYRTYNEHINSIISSIKKQYPKISIIIHNFNQKPNTLILNKYNFLVFKIDELEKSDQIIYFFYKQLINFTRVFELYCKNIINKTINNEPISDEMKSKISNALLVLDEPLEYNNAGSWTSTINKNKEENEEKDAHELLNSLQSILKPQYYLGKFKFDRVLSFNFTDTFERLYGDKETEYCYIHGKAQQDPTKINLIFGIDDNLNNGEENKDFTFVRFKKYFQRIVNKTGSEYKNWLKKPTQDVNAINTIHIVGHSLDKTDYDILYELFTNEYFKVIVYYFNENDFVDKVQKVIKLLSYKGINRKEELIKRVHGSNWSIKFVNQYDENEGLFIHPDNRNK